MMIMYKAAVTAVYEALSKRETVQEMDKPAKVEHGYPEEQSCLIVRTEYMDAMFNSQNITFNILLPASFPLVIPKIYIGKSSRDPFRYLPHVNMTNGGICTFDEDTVRPDPNDPAGIVLACLARAKEILELGVREANYQDYEDEFMTYWIRQYKDEPEMDAHTICLFSGEPDTPKLELIQLNKPLGIYKFVMHQNDQDAERFLSYLKSKSVTYTKVPVCYLGRVPFDFTPPYDRKNKEVKRLVTSLPLQVMTKYKSYINSKIAPKIVTAGVLVSGTFHLIGWRHPEFKLVGKRDGFRKGKTSNYELLSSLQANDFVARLYFSIYSSAQKLIRTEGIVKKEPEKKLLVAGLGSIGSNLTFFLNSNTNTNFTLVDPDFVSMDNLNRHFLGFESLWKNKAEAMHNYLVEKNPLQKITFFKSSIISLVENGRKLLDEVDYIFMVTGKANIDEFMSSVCSAHDLNKPIFILWVEPYLSAGHCLYLHPEGSRYADFFDSDDFFINNVIDKAEYQKNHPLLSLKQSGCHTSYVPYGMNAITRFIAGIFPEINQIFNKDCKTSKAFTWIGDLQYLRNLGIKVVDAAVDLKEGSIIIHHD